MDNNYIRNFPIYKFFEINSDGDTRKHRQTRKVDTVAIWLTDFTMNNDGNIREKKKREERSISEHVSRNSSRWSFEEAGHETKRWICGWINEDDIRYPEMWNRKPCYWIAQDNSHAVSEKLVKTGSSRVVKRLRRNTRNMQNLYSSVSIPTWSLPISYSYLPYISLYLIFVGRIGTRHARIAEETRKRRVYDFDRRNISCHCHTFVKRIYTLTIIYIMKVMYIII